MEVFTITLAVLMVVFAILQIILFFKIWGMTNTVSDIFMILKAQKVHRANESGGSAFKVGDLVKNKAGRQMRITGISDGKCICHTNSGVTYEGAYSEDELSKF